MRELQERERTTTKKQDIEQHEAASARFENLFRRCESWARRYFKLDVGDFRMEEFPPFAHEVELEAMALAANISQQASKLVIVDKEWFQKNGRKLGRNDDRMKDRFGDGGGNP